MVKNITKAGTGKPTADMQRAINNAYKVEQKAPRGTVRKMYHVQTGTTKKGKPVYETGYTQEKGEKFVRKDRK